MNLKYPEDVVRIARIFASNGYKGYAVGGCMRDIIMGREPNDWDMTTDCSPEGMLEIFEKAGIRTIPTGLKHGTLTVLIGKNTYECTTFRIDGSYTDSRHPDKVIFTADLSDDLCRRDFTVNAMAGDPLDENGGVVDIFGGKKDIENRLICAVGDPEKRFSEDALRILRAVRFATVLGFEIEDQTKKAATMLAHRLADISAERKTVEFQKILLSADPDRGMKLLFETGLAKYIHPDIVLPKLSLSALPKSFPTRLAALFNGVPNLGRMKLSNEVSRAARLLCDSENYNSCRHFYENDAANARLMLSKYGDMAYDAALLRQDIKFAEIIADERDKKPCVTIRELAIGGNDLLQANIEAKRIGGIMNELLSAVIEEPSLNEKNTLIRLATKAEK